MTTIVSAEPKGVGSGEKNMHFHIDFFRALLNSMDLSPSLQRVHKVTRSKTLFNVQLSNCRNDCGIGALGKTYCCSRI